MPRRIASEPEAIMDKAEAREILQVDSNATDNAIRQAVAQRGNEVTDDRQAYERVIEAGRELGVIGRGEPSAASSTALVLREAGELAQMRRHSLEVARLGQEERRLRHEEAERQVQHVTEVRIDPLRRARRRYAWCGGAAGFVGAIGLLMRGLGSFYGAGTGGDTVLVTGAAAAVAVGAIVGLLAAVLSLRVQTLDAAFDDVADTLSRRAALAGLLTDILGEIGVPADERSIVAEEALEDAADEWMTKVRESNHEGPAPTRDRRIDLRHRALRIGPSAFTQILIAKGKECEILSEREELNERGRLVVGYRVRIAPRTESDDSSGQTPAEDGATSPGSYA
jgi:hypothetical protein